MEDIEKYLGALNRSAALAKKIEETLEEDKENINKGLSGESEEVYKKQCNKAIEQIKKIRKTIMVLYSESSAGY
jgi:hypothetical protein